MKIKKKNLAIFSLLLTSFMLSILFYPAMPDTMASHWNFKGEVDGYMPKIWGLFLTPLLMLFLAAVFYLIPRIDPLKANIQKFKKHYKRFIIILFAFLWIIQMQIILWNLGVQISPTLYMPLSLGILFYYLGVLCENARPNWFIGIRTPWTLTSKRVWFKTHRLGGKLFKGCGMTAFLAMAFPQASVYLLAVPIILVSIFAVIYSYVEFQKIVT